MLIDRIDLFVRYADQKHPGEHVLLVGHQGLNRALIGVLVPYFREHPEKVPFLKMSQNIYMRIDRNSPNARLHALYGADIRIVGNNFEMEAH
jgi:hypothetical protein